MKSINDSQAKDTFCSTIENVDFFSQKLNSIPKLSEKMC